MTDFASATRISLAALHLEMAQTMSELSECDLSVIGPRAQAAGYLFGVRGINRPVSLKCWIKRSEMGEKVYAVKS